MIKKRLAVIAVAASILLCGCSGKTNNSSVTDESNSDEKISVVTTIFPAYDFARQVFGDTAEITLLLKPGMESHSYDPSAKDIVKIDDCDLFIYNGGESDAWVENILDSTENVNSLRMMDSVEAIEEELVEGMEAEDEEHGEEHEEEEYDEHIWTSPKNAALIVKSIEDKAVELFPENKSTYTEAGDKYIEKINDLDERFSTLLKGENRYFVFGDRFPLLYFFKEYNLNYYAAFPGCGSETEPSAQTVAFLTGKLADEDTVKTVFYIELSNHKLADTLASEQNLPTAEFHACHNISADDFSAGETYVSIMERNYTVLENALKN